jgi:uncharacterized tellurite resistance protein B-like protein
MLDAIRTFLTDLTGATDKRDLGEDDARLAAAALLFRAIAIDGEVSPDERKALFELLMRQFDLDAEGAASLVADAEEAEKEAIDLYGFTSVLKERFDEAERERIVEMMWKLVYADGTVHEFEDNLIWRVAELLGVSSQTRIRLKQSVRDASSH